jgi:hypothetical protein
MADNGPHHLPHRNPPRTSDQPPHAQLAAAGIAATHGTRRDTGLLRPTCYSYGQLYCRVTVREYSYY